MSIKRLPDTTSEPLPIGSYVATTFRVTGYDRDVDGTPMARLEHVDRNGETTGWDVGCIGLSPKADVLLDHPEDLHEAT